MQQGRSLTGQVVSVNVGKPQSLAWRGQEVRTAIQKSPVQGRVMARRLDLDGDEQADLEGHGGENRAMLVYQLDSYRFWQTLFDDAPYPMGWFGENLTVEGLPDGEVCIGDRFRIGEALVEVSQPRVTCYRLAIRTGRPDMPSLFVKHGRPGFYVRVIEEGTIGANDQIELVESATARMTITATDQLLFFGSHPPADLRRALSIDALSQGWKGSFKALLEAHEKGPIVGNPGLTREAIESWQGFQSLRVLSNEPEGLGVRSIRLGSPDGKALAPFLPGQYIVLKARTAEGGTLVRSYSLSGDPAGATYRVSIKRELGSAGSGLLQDQLQAGTTIEASAPRSDFTLGEGSNPVVLLSAGIGVTPLLSMLHALAMTDRKVFWVHGERDGSYLGFRDEVDSLLATLLASRRFIAFSQPAGNDVMGHDYDMRGRLNMEALARFDLPSDAEYYLCGPSNFLHSFREGLQETGVDPTRIHFESFGDTPAQRKGAGDDTFDGTAFAVRLTRSNRVLQWSQNSGSLLELAEANQIAIPFACRVGVCHRCETAVLDGTIAYAPEPLDPPSTGRVLMCCAHPTSNLALDL